MTTAGEAYLAIILSAFFAYVATLFWAMVTSSRVSPTVDERRSRND
jgi:hypothetical protein